MIGSILEWALFSWFTLGTKTLKSIDYIVSAPSRLYYQKSAKKNIINLALGIDQPFLLHQYFDDFDDYCVNARNWNLDYRQIESGPFSGELLMAGNGTALLTRAKIGRKMIQKGATPRGMITIGILADPGVSLYWRNINISGDLLFVFPENGELDSISHIVRWTPFRNVEVSELKSSFEFFEVVNLEAECGRFRFPRVRRLLSGMRSVPYFQTSRLGTEHREVICNYLWKLCSFISHLFRNS